MSFNTIASDIGSSVHTVLPRVEGIIGAHAFVDEEGLFRFDAKSVIGKGLKTSAPSYVEMVTVDAQSVVERVVEKSGVPLDDAAEMLNSAMPFTVTTIDSSGRDIHVLTITDDTQEA